MMKKAKRKFNKSKHHATAMNKSQKMVTTEVIKQLVPKKPEKLVLKNLNVLRRGG